MTQHHFPTNPLMFNGDYGADGGDLPLGPMFAWLRERWLEQDEERTSTALAQHLDVSPQQITNWAHRSAPLWGVVRLASELGLAIVIEASRVYAIEGGRTLTVSPDMLFVVPLEARAP